MPTYADVCRRMPTYADALDTHTGGVRGRARDACKHVQGYLCGGREYRYLLFTCFTCFTSTKLDTLRMGFCLQKERMPATRRACLQLERMPATRAQVCNYSASLQLDELLALLVQNYEH
jgi:hypothetical protein